MTEAARLARPETSKSRKLPIWTNRSEAISYSIKGKTKRSRSYERQLPIDARSSIHWTWPLTESRPIFYAPARLSQQDADIQSNRLFGAEKSMKFQSCPSHRKMSHDSTPRVAVQTPTRWKLRLKK
jgi:hypothetical protein